MVGVKKVGVAQERDGGGGWWVKEVGVAQERDGGGGGG